MKLLLNIGKILPIPENIWDTTIDEVRIKERNDFLFNRFGRPINIPTVELGTVECPQLPPVATLESIQPHSVVEADPPKNPYMKVCGGGIKR
jgi:hypothetical protein